MPNGLNLGPHAPRGVWGQMVGLMNRSFICILNQARISKGKGDDASDLLMSSQDVLVMKAERNMERGRF